MAPKQRGPGRSPLVHRPLLLPDLSWAQETSPPLIGHLYDTTGSYTLPLTLFLACFAIPATLLLFLRIPGETRD
jgi:hypothetical protein